ncbi:MAG: DUF4124 domain-containing protein [Rhizobium sp.]|nr:MAG: DUF4124 domain-containing protein [Rhizobium sp.]
MRTLACLALLMCSTSALAGDGKLYKYVDPNGQVHFTDQPPSRGAKPLVLDGGRPAMAKKKWDDAAAVEIIRKATRFAVHWSLPTPGQIYSSAGDGLLVAVSVMPGLAQGFGIIYEVDGRTLTPHPVYDISTTLHGIGAGKHQLVAILLGKNGSELARSVPVSIEIKDPPAKK